MHKISRTRDYPFSDGRVSIQAGLQVLETAQNYNWTQNAQQRSKKVPGCPVPAGKKPTYQPKELTHDQPWREFKPKGFKRLSPGSTAWRKATQEHAERTG
jgi:hypothetical protein